MRNIGKSAESHYISGLSGGNPTAFTESVDDYRHPFITHFLCNVSIEEASLHLREEELDIRSTELGRVHLERKSFPSPIHNGFVEKVYLFGPIQIHGSPKSK